MKVLPPQTVRLQKFIGGGQVLGQLDNGKKIFVWGGLPGETVVVRVTKQRSSYVEGVVESVVEASSKRIVPQDPDSYLSTSPWQIMAFATEQAAKAQLVKEAYELHDLTLQRDPTIYSNEIEYGYRNKVEYSWWWDTELEQLDLAFFKRGSKGKIPVSGTSLARPEINKLAIALRDLLRTKPVEGRSLKTLLIRCDQAGNTVWQLYVRDRMPKLITEEEANNLPAQGGEIIYSDPKSPASRITERLTHFGDTALQDEITGIKFGYAAESFFQVNIPVYERALGDMLQHVAASNTKNIIDLYSGVGSIGLIVSAQTNRPAVLVEIDEHAYKEMQTNINLQHSTAQAVLAPTEKALEYIQADSTIIVDPPRAGLHAAVIDTLLEEAPPTIIYLSCNPVTQARDVALLQNTYQITWHAGYNFFPRTPHIEYLVVLQKK